MKSKGQAQFASSDLRQNINPKTLRKTLSWIDDEFTFQDLYKKMNERKVFGDISESTVYSRIHNMKRIGAIEIKESIGKKGGGFKYIYAKTDNYKD